MFGYCCGLFYCVLACSDLLVTFGLDLIVIV